MLLFALQGSNFNRAAFCSAAETQKAANEKHSRLFPFRSQCGLTLRTGRKCAGKLLPHNIFFAGTKFKVIFYNAQVHLAVKAQPGFGANRAVLVRKIKFLLIHCSGGKQGGIYPVLKPLGRACARIAHRIAAFRAMGAPVGNPVAKGNHSGQLFVVANLACIGCFSVCQAYPAGVQAKLLGPQHKLLPVTAACFIQVAAFCTHQGDIVLHAGKLSVVCQKAVKCPGLVEHQLDMKAACLVAALYFLA